VHLHRGCNEWTKGRRAERRRRSTAWVGSAWLAQCQPAELAAIKKKRPACPLLLLLLLFMFLSVLFRVQTEFTLLLPLLIHCSERRSGVRLMDQKKRSSSRRLPI
jgi:hypothetical protein